MSETILISLVGNTPGVLTETVWALAMGAEPILPDRIIAVTTSSGADLVREKLFESGHWEKMLGKLRRQNVEFSNKLRFGDTGRSIRVFTSKCETRELDDIRTLEDNEAVSEFFMELIRSFTENDSTSLMVSIAGGRKTTSALLHSVMTLLGRSQDSINHILVNEEWIHQPDFLYPGCDGDFISRETNERIESSSAELQLVEVPFVPLRYLFKRDLDSTSGYMQLINRIRDRSVNVDEDLTVALDTQNGVLEINGIRIELSANEFLFYLFFALHAKENGQKAAARSYANLEQPLSDLKSKWHAKSDFFHWSHKSISSGFDAGEDIRKWVSEIRRKLRSAGLEPFQIDRLVPRGGNLRIELPPENILIDEN